MREPTLISVHADPGGRQDRVDNNALARSGVDDEELRLLVLHRDKRRDGRLEATYSHSHDNERDDAAD